MCFITTYRCQGFPNLITWTSRYCSTIGFQGRKKAFQLDHVLQINHAIWQCFIKCITLFTKKRLHSSKEFTHNGISASNRGCVARDSEAGRARVKASRVSPVHLTAMQGVVLRRKRQLLPFLECIKKHNNNLNAQLDIKSSMMHQSRRSNYALSKKKKKSQVWRQSSPVCLGGWWQWRIHADSDGGSFPTWQNNQAEPST